MAKTKFFILRIDDTGILARAKDAGKDKDIPLFGNLPEGLAEGAVISCNGKWRFDPKKGYSFEVDECVVERRGIGSAIRITCTTKSRAIRSYPYFGILLNDIYTGQGEIKEDGSICTLPLCEGINKLTICRGKRSATIRIPDPEPGCTYTLKISLGILGPCFVVSAPDGDVLVDESMSAIWGAVAFLFPLLGIVYSLVNLVKGRRIVSWNTCLLIFFGAYIWIVISAIQYGGRFPILLPALFGPAAYFLA